MAEPVPAALPEPIRGQLLRLQRQEITQHHICRRLLARTRDADNRALLARMADDELRHYQVWAAHTGQAVAPDHAKVRLFVLLSRVFGLTFGLRLLEQQEQAAETVYANLVGVFPEAQAILLDEDEHEQALIARIQEERLDYMGSVVLGVSDALVELTGALAGFTLALQNARLIAAVGLITGIAAALSMGASEYLSVKSEAGQHARKPLKAALYTGSAYLVTVALLVLPYLVLSRLYGSLAWSLANAVGIIVVFTFYQSVVYAVPLRQRLFEMAGLTLGVAAVSFGLGWAVRRWLGVDV